MTTKIAQATTALQLRIARLRRFGMTEAQALALAGLVWGAPHAG